MKAKVKFDDFREMTATMEITMSLREWVELKEVIKSDYPGWKFSGLIGKLISDAQAHFETEKNYEA